jgi:hypothetical protein
MDICANKAIIKILKIRIMSKNRTARLPNGRRAVRSFF